MHTEVHNETGSTHGHASSVHSMAPRLILCVVQIGPPAPHFYLWRASVVASRPSLAVMLYTDQSVAAASNLHVTRGSMRDLRERLARFLGKYGGPKANLSPDKLILPPPWPRGSSDTYKLCDVKVVYRYLFERELIASFAPRPDDYVGYADLDVVYGDVAGFMRGRYRATWPALASFETIGYDGHLTALRWRSSVWNDLLTTAHFAWILDALQKPAYQVLDEGRFRRFLLLRAGFMHPKATSARGVAPPPAGGAAHRPSAFLSLEEESRAVRELPPMRWAAFRERDTLAVEGGAGPEGQPRLSVITASFWPSRGEALPMMYSGLPGAKPTLRRGLTGRLVWQKSGHLRRESSDGSNVPLLYAHCKYSLVRLNRSACEMLNVTEPEGCDCRDVPREDGPALCSRASSQEQAFGQEEDFRWAVLSDHTAHVLVACANRLCAE